MADLVGKTLGKYRVIARLGRGGMAEVYRGYHPRLDRYVAIKVLHAHLAEGGDFLARFEREARAAAALRHPHIVQVFDFDAEGDIYYIVMGCVGSTTLKTRLEEMAREKATLPLPEVARIVGEIAQALDYAHAHGVLHRDVKPSNVLLDPAGRAVLSDFGIAQIVGGARYTTTGTLMGTPAYMSPEQCKGEELAPASDIYALGVILYELVTGRVPFAADTPLGVAHKQIHEPLPAPRTCRPDLPPALEEVICKALAKDPAARYQRAAEMAEAVERALGASPTQPETRPIEEQAEPPVAPAKAPPEDDLTALQTVLMAEEPAGAEGPPSASPEADLQPSAGEEEGEVEPQAPPRPQPAPRRPWLGRRMLVLGIGLAALALLAIVVAVVFSSNRGPGSCSTPAECERLARQAMERGDPEAAAALVGQALELVPASERHLRAGLCCWQGEIYRALGRRERAVDAFRCCLECTEGIPELGELRGRAEQALRELPGP